MKVNVILVGCFLFFTSLSAQVIEKSRLTEVEKLLQRKEIKNAFQYITSIDDQTIKDMITLTEIPSPSFHEQDKAKVFAEMLKISGADSVFIDEVGNVIGIKKGKGKLKKKIVLDAHLDTVFPFGTDVKVKQRGDTLFAPGITDANRSLAVVNAVLKTMVQQNIHTEHDIWFVGTVGEEGLGDLYGVKHLFKSQQKPFDSFIAVDGGGLDDITNGGIGSKRYKVTFKGSGGHSYGAFGIANPHHALSNTVSVFVPLADELTKNGPKTTYSISMVGGGTSVNSIPYESWMLVDMRSEDQDKLKAIEGLFLESIDKGLKQENSRKKRGENLTVDIEKVGDRPSGFTEVTSPLIQQAMAVAKVFGGVEPKLSSGSTNSNLPFSIGVPAVTIGRGGIGAGAHSLDEWFLNKDGHKGVQQVLLILLLQANIL
jgi:acetylornithine deacetylase/succinyl-diaminopimelate desuccinylase-like protein